MADNVGKNPITSILTNTRNASQNELIQVAAEMSRDMPDIMGYCIVIWDANESLSFVEPWPYSPEDVGDVIKENVSDFFTDAEGDTVMIFGSIVSAVGGIVSAYMENKVEQTKAKGALSIAIENRKTRMATGEIDWDQTMAEASKDSWKDEYILLLWSIPLVLSFTGDDGVDVVMRGFEALEKAPNWYTMSLGIIVAASYGVRSATKFFKK
jgi:hypothetical protein